MDQDAEPALGAGLMALIKSAAEILRGRSRPVELTGWSRVGPEGRRPLDRQCGLPDCSRRHHGHKLCLRHLRVRDKWGDPYHVYVPRGGRDVCGCKAHKGQGGR